jgi:glutamate-ammonia-ligase adenylyltransferase
LEASLAELCRNAIDIEPILHAFKASQQLRVGVRDMIGRQDATATTAALTAIAEACLKVVVGHEQARLVERLGLPQAGDGSGGPAGPVVLAMGKCGGREMNYASDVDVVFLYDHEGVALPRRRQPRPGDGTTNAHFFGELAQRTGKVFNTLGPRGRLYELDSRLRPSGRSGPPAISLDEFARYFASDGPAAVWERQALVKARVAIGSAAAAERVGSIIAVAAYDRSWTAADVELIRQMRLRMEQGARPTNLKRGPGGVVDIEFIAQMLQLVHGGANPALRTPETLAALDALHAAGHLAADDHAALVHAYRTFRDIEGRLRLLDAPARHDFPAATAEQRSLALLLGRHAPDRLVADVQALTAHTRDIFERIFTTTAANL